MAWAQVDFSLVRYSPIENTHFFYDEAHPSTIQFLLTGRWESWDVSYVGYKAKDPDIRRICRDAAARLSHDPQSGYVQWPEEPQPGAGMPIADGQPPPRAYEQETPQTPFTDLIADLIPLSPSPEAGPAYPPPQPVSQQYAHQPVPPNVNNQYASPYGHPGIQSVPYPPQVAAGNAAPTPAPPLNDYNANGNAVQQQAYVPPIQPAPGDGGRAILSRTRETKILLSIDGDGIRGLSSLLLIESLVNAICVKIGQRLDCHQIFDLTGGSSLGGVIAILLCRLQMQAHRAREAYKDIARQVFINKRAFFISFDPHVATPSSDGMALEEEIKKVIQAELGTPDERLFDGRPDSGDVFVVSTHMEIGTNKAALLRSYQTRRIAGPELDANMTIAQAMKATSVAPKYMPPTAGVNHRMVIEPGLVDNGTAKNNPVRDILFECRKLFRYTNDMMIIVSIGTGIGMDRETEILEMADSVDNRNAEARAWGEKFEADQQALMDRNWMRYYRFNVPGLEDVPLEEWCHEDMIKEKTSEYLAQPAVSHMFYACVDAITALLLMPGQQN